MSRHNQDHLDAFGHGHKVKAKHAEAWARNAHRRDAWGNKKPMEPGREVNTGRGHGFLGFVFGGRR